MLWCSQEATLQTHPMTCGLQKMATDGRKYHQYILQYAAILRENCNVFYSQLDCIPPASLSSHSLDSLAIYSSDVGLRFLMESSFMSICALLYVWWIAVMPV
jgi:hypothetical protein